jgi:hypothetical protein
MKLRLAYPTSPSTLRLSLPFAGAQTLSVLFYKYCRPMEQCGRHKIETITTHKER